MNKFKNLLILYFLLIACTSNAQDLIVTNEGDSLNCKITKIDTKYIHFTFKHKEEIRNTLLPLWQVKKHQIDFYKTPEVPQVHVEKVKVPGIYPHFRFAVSGGWSYRIAEVSNGVSADLKDYINELKSGYHYRVDMSYFTSEHIGFGLMYDRSMSKNSIDNIYLKTSDNIAVDFIGPFLSTRLLNQNKKNSFLIGIGLGYMGYTDKSVVTTDHLTIKGSTVGLHYNFGYDIGISESLAIGFEISYVTGMITQFKVSDGTRTETRKLEKDQYESLNRFDFSVGLRLIK